MFNYRCFYHIPPFFPQPDPAWHMFDLAAAAADALAKSVLCGHGMASENGENEEHPLNFWYIHIHTKFSNKLIWLISMKSMWKFTGATVLGGEGDTIGYNEAPIGIGWGFHRGETYSGRHPSMIRVVFCCGHRVSNHVSWDPWDMFLYLDDLDDLDDYSNRYRRFNSRVRNLGSAQQHFGCKQLHFGCKVGTWLWPLAQMGCPRHGRVFS